MDWWLLPLFLSLKDLLLFLVTLAPASHVLTKWLPQLSWHNAWHLKFNYSFHEEKEEVGMHFSLGPQPYTMVSPWHNKFFLFRIVCYSVSFLSRIQPSPAADTSHNLLLIPPSHTDQWDITGHLLCVSFSEPDAVGNKLENVRHGFYPSKAYVLVRENVKIWESIIKYPEHLNRSTRLSVQSQVSRLMGLFCFFCFVLKQKVLEAPLFWSQRYDVCLTPRGR